MKIATYNVNGINGRLSVLLRWLKEAKPDIVCLQELKASQEKFPETAISKAGYHAIWNGQRSWNGVAILSRQKNIQLISQILPGDPDDIQSRYLEAMVGDLVIACLYLPNGNPAPGPKFDYKQRWFERLIARARILKKFNIPVILIGDFNVIPGKQDVYHPERWEDNALYRNEVRLAYKKLLAQGWTDAIRTLYPHDQIYTFWDYLYHAWSRDAGMRIDHVLLSPHLVKKLQDGGVDKHVRGWTKASDHAPVWIHLKN